MELTQSRTRMRGLDQDWLNGTPPSTCPLSSELFTRFWIKKAFRYRCMVKLDPNKSLQGLKQMKEVFCRGGGDPIFCSVKPGL